MPSATLIAERYQLLDQLGRGATGQVWRARDLVLERSVAVKTVDLAHQDDPAAEQRFRREAVTMAGVNHPNVVGIFDAGVDDDMAYLVMELLSGPDLRTFALNDAWGADFERLIPILRQVALGLHAAHRNGVVHRDVKPANVVMDHDTPKIVDFGIATLTNHSATLTAPATAIGTASYMSPEQALGRHVSPASDWYSFGCCVMAVLTGQPPFVADSAIAVATAQINEPPPLMTDRRHDSPLELTRLVNELLAKEPADRPSGTAIVARLDAAFAELRYGPPEPSDPLADGPTEWIEVTEPSPTAFISPTEAADRAPIRQYPPPAPAYEVAEPQQRRRRRRQRGYPAPIERRRRPRGVGRGIFRGLVTGGAIVALFYGLGWLLSGIL